METFLKQLLLASEPGVLCAFARSNSASVRLILPNHPSHRDCSLTHIVVRKRSLRWRVPERYFFRRGLAVLV